MDHVPHTGRAEAPINPPLGLIEGYQYTHMDHVPHTGRAEAPINQPAPGAD